MILQKKIDRAMNWLKEKNSSAQNNNNEYSEKFPQDNSDLSSYDPKAEWDAQNNSNIEFEKKDIIAMIISALMVFGPIFLILIVILILLYPGLNAIIY